MKATVFSLIFFTVLSIVATDVAAQGNFNAMNYQAVARDANGEPIANQTISVKFTLLYSSFALYAETHTTVTDEKGLFTAAIGTGTLYGTPVFSDLEEIKWYISSNWSLEVSVDPSGGTNYVSLGSSPLRTVPFASLSKASLSLLDSSVVVNPWDTTVVMNNGYELGIGTSNPEADLHVAGTLRFNDGNEDAGNVLTTDAQGNATWAPIDLAYGEAVVPGDIVLPLTSSYTTLVSFPIVEPGTYQITISVRGRRDIASITAAVFVNGIKLPNSETMIVNNDALDLVEATATSVHYFQNGFWGANVSLRARSSFGGNPSAILSNPQGYSKISYLRIGP